MPLYKITDNETGNTLTIDAEREPSQEDVSEIFSQHKAGQPAPAAAEPAPATVPDLSGVKPDPYQKAFLQSGMIDPMQEREQNVLRQVANVSLPQALAEAGTDLKAASENLLGKELLGTLTGSALSVPGRIMDMVSPPPAPDAEGRQVLQAPPLSTRLRMKAMQLPVIGRAFDPEAGKTEIAREVERGLPQPRSVGEALKNASDELIAGLATPENFALALTGGAEAKLAEAGARASSEAMRKILPATAHGLGRAVSAYFAAEMGKGALEKGKEMIAPGKTGYERLQAGLGMAGSGVMALGAGAHAVGPRARATGELAAHHIINSALDDASRTGRPFQEVIGDHIAELEAKRKEVPLTEPEQNILESMKRMRDDAVPDLISTAQKEAGNIGLPARVFYLASNAMKTLPEDHPWNGVVATVLDDGQILIHEKNLREQLSAIPADRRLDYLRGLLTEEGIHALARQMFTKKEFADLYNSLTDAERAIFENDYFGNAEGRSKYRGEYTNTVMGEEYFRRQMQRALRMTLPEVSRGPVGKNLAQPNFNAMLERLIVGMRQGAAKLPVLGKHEKMTPILNRMLGELDARLKASRGEVEPALTEYGQGQTPASMFTVKPEKPITTDEFVRTLEDPSAKLVNKVSIAAGMGVKSIADLDRINDVRKAASAELNRILDMPPGPERDAAMKNIHRVQMQGQLAREAIETATGTGSWQESDLIQLGKRPVDVRDNPQAAAWLKEHGLARETPASRRTQRGEEGTEKLPLLPLDVKAGEKRPSATELGAEPGTLPLAPASKGEARPTAVELGAEPVTARAMETHAAEYLGSTITPNFQEFLESSRRRYGGVGEAALKDAWERQVWDRLLTASGEELKDFARGLGMDKEIRGQEVVRNIPESLGHEGEAKYPPGVDIYKPGFGKREVKKTPERIEADRARYNMIAAIGNRLVTEAEGGKAAYRRKTITPEELAAPKLTEEGEPLKPVFEDFTSRDEDRPNVLAEKLVDGARSFGGAKLRKSIGRRLVEVKQKGNPVSVTKRVTAIQDRKTGKVSLVSTFKDGRRGTVLLDPQSPGGKVHVPLESILKRYRVVASALLHAPVKDFRQEFKSLGEFNNEFAVAARNQSEQTLSYTMSQLLGEEQEPSVWTRDVPITNAEAISIIEHADEMVGQIKGADDIRAALMDLAEDPNQKNARTVISAYRKLAEEIQNKNPDLATEELLDKLAEQVYETHKQSKTFDEFISRTVAQGAAKRSQDVGVVGEAKPSETTRTLTGLERPEPIPTEKVEHTPEQAPPPAGLMTPEEAALIQQKALEKHPEPEGWSYNPLLVDPAKSKAGVVKTYPRRPELTQYVVVRGQRYKVPAWAAKGIIPGRRVLVLTPSSRRVIEAYHGTPHEWAPETKWRTPDGKERWYEDGNELPPEGSVVVERAPAGRARADKAGTGEGEMAYGWGVIYAAEEPQVAANYRRQLSKLGKLSTEDAKELLRKIIPNASEAALDTIADKSVWVRNEKGRAGAIEALAKKHGVELPSELTGNEYTVEISRPETFIDNDKPLAEQNSTVKAKLKPLIDMWIDEAKKSGGAQGEFIWAKQLEEGDVAMDVLYMALTSYWGKVDERGYMIGGEREASEYLHRLGIGGYKYLDQGSRITAAVESEGTRNFVVFNENDIRVTGKNGKPVSMEEFQKQHADKIDAEAAKAAASPGPASIFTKAQEVVQKSKEALHEELVMRKEQLQALGARRATKKEIVELNMGYENDARRAGVLAGQAVKIASADLPAQPGRKGVRIQQAEALKRRQAATAVISAGEDTLWGWSPNPVHLGAFLVQVRQGANKARLWAQSFHPVKRHWGKKWLQACKEAEEEILYAQSHWTDPQLMDTALATRQELHDTIVYENANGFQTKERANYIPNPMDGEFFTDQGFTFGPIRALGTNYRRAKTFSNPYKALAAGPYIRLSRDVASLVQNRVTRGQQLVATLQFGEALKGLRDEVTGLPVAMDASPIMEKKTYTDPNTGQSITVNVVSRYSPARKDHELVHLFQNGKPISVRKGYSGLVSIITQPSRIETIYGKEAKNITEAMKHGAILILDTFHPGRIIQLGAALGGGNWLDFRSGYRGGLSALTYRPQDLQKAVALGWVSQKSADWANTPVEWRTPHGTTIQLTRQQIIQQAVQMGANASSMADALYKDVVQNIPFLGKPIHAVIGPLNRFTFDRLIPGMMSESIVRNFERMMKENPGADSATLLRDIIKDHNTRFGNMGKMGVFKSKTLGDVAQILMLAPRWVEGLVQSEARTYARLGGLVARPVAKAFGKELPYRQGLPMLGALGRSTLRGLAAYFVLAQAANLVSRGKLTLQNEEEDHKLDAFIPLGGDKGLWISTLGVFAEVTHDVLRLSGTKERKLDVLTQILFNKASPLSRAGITLGTGKTPTGEYISSTGKVLKESAKQMVPVPISLGTPIRAIAHEIAPGRVSPPRPGQLAQRILGSSGVKAEIAKDHLGNAQMEANHFVEVNNLKAVPTMHFEPTDEPSYSKFRGALRHNDMGAAKDWLTGLRKSHPGKVINGKFESPDQQIEKALKKWSMAPLTRSADAEKWFISSLDDKGYERYQKAMLQKQVEYMNAREFLYSVPDPGEP